MLLLFYIDNTIMFLEIEGEKNTTGWLPVKIEVLDKTDVQDVEFEISEDS